MMGYGKDDEFLTSTIILESVELYVYVWVNKKVSSIVSDRTSKKIFPYMIQLGSIAAYLQYSVILRLPIHKNFRQILRVL